jgi:hypothetical protein
MAAKKRKRRKTSEGDHHSVLRFLRLVAAISILFFFCVFCGSPSLPAAPTYSRTLL